MKINSRASNSNGAKTKQDEGMYTVRSCLCRSQELAKINDQSYKPRGELKKSGGRITGS